MKKRSTPVTPDREGGPAVERRLQEGRMEGSFGAGFPNRLSSSRRSRIVPVTGRNEDRMRMRRAGAQGRSKKGGTASRFALCSKCRGLFLCTGPQREVCFQGCMRAARRIGRKIFPTRLVWAEMGDLYKAGRRRFGKRDNMSWKFWRDGYYCNQDDINYVF